MRRGKGSTRTAKPQQAESYKHPESTSPMRPDVGTQAQFKKRKPPATYRYDSSLSPALDWDGQNPVRELGEQQLSVLEEQLAAVRGQLSVEKPGPESLKVAADAARKATDAAEKLKALSKPFLNWAGKAERLSFDVPTLFTNGSPPRPSSKPSPATGASAIRASSACSISSATRSTPSPTRYCAPTSTATSG
jgi:adenine-specific DNA-methyltransferase